MDVVPLDPHLVKGSHGLAPAREEEGPVIVSSEARLLPDGPVDATDVKALVLDHVFTHAPVRRAPARMYGNVRQSST
jgi:hypothetical protein